MTVLVSEMPRLFHSVQQETLDLALDTLDRLRAANTRVGPGDKEGSPGHVVYRDDELLLFALCEMLTPPTEVQQVNLTSNAKVPEGVDGDVLHDALRRLVLFDREYQAHKDFFETRRKLIQAIVGLVGRDYHFQDDEGVVYRFVEPEGTFVKFEKLAVERTRRPGEKKGSMSMEDGRRLGYQVEGK